MMQKHFLYFCMFCNSSPAGPNRVLFLLPEKYEQKPSERATKRSIDRATDRSSDSATSFLKLFFHLSTHILATLITTRCSERATKRSNKLSHTGRFPLMGWWGIAKRIEFEDIAQGSMQLFHGERFQSQSWSHARRYFPHSGHTFTTNGLEFHIADMIARKLIKELAY